MKPKTNVRGAKRLFNALLYSFSGLKALIRETAFRQELFFAILLLSSLILIQATALHILIALVLHTLSSPRHFIVLSHIVP